MSDSCGTVGSVLVIDNDPVTQAVVEAYFRASGASDVITASDGRSAMDIVNERGGEIGVVLCDLNTPDAEDFNFLRHLTDSSYKGQIAILNGDRAAPAEKRERAAGSPALNLVHSIRKPLDLRDLEVLTSASGSDSGQADSDERTYIVSPQDLQLGLNCRHVVPYYHPKVCTYNHLSRRPPHARNGSEIAAFVNHNIGKCFTFTRIWGIAHLTIAPQALFSAIIVVNGESRGRGSSCGVGATEGRCPS